jgi:hypothetical protein
MNQPGRVACTLSEGMFENEYAVQIDLIDGKKVSLFADADLVKINGSKETGYLIVNIVKDESPAPTILLPSEAFETGSRWVQVPRDKLEWDQNDPQQRRNR